MENNPETAEQAGNKAKARAISAIIGFLAVLIAIWLLNPEELYLWIKAMHVIAIIAWMAGMVYLPRLFVYHVDAESGSVQSETFKVMERRLLKVIMNPAMIISWVLGVWLAWSGGHFFEFWFLVKFLAVIGMSAVHGYYSKAVKIFAAEKNTVSASRWRLLNELPTVLMILIVLMVVIKPF